MKRYPPRHHASRLPSQSVAKRGRKVQAPSASPTQTVIAVPTAQVVHEHQSREAIPYDENLLERSRTQWQFGDWDSLAALGSESLQHHPDRAKLALLAAAGLQQTGKIKEAGHYVRLAREWGCSKRLVSQILIAGVHNTLGRAAAAITGQGERALKHFNDAISTGAPGSDARLITPVRISSQLAQLGLGAQSGTRYALTAAEHLNNLEFQR